MDRTLITAVFIILSGVFFVYRINPYWVMAVFAVFTELQLPFFRGAMGLSFEPIFIFIIFIYFFGIKRPARVSRLSLRHYLFLAGLVPVLLHYLNEPVGFYALGSQAGGAKTYINVLLGFIIFYILSNNVVTALSAKKIIKVLIVTFLINTIGGVLASYCGGVFAVLFPFAVPREEGSRLTLLSVFYILFLLVLSYLDLRLKQRRKIKGTFFLSLSIFMLIISGGFKAGLIMGLLLYLFILKLHAEKARVWPLAFVAVVFLFILINGHGRYWQLPYSIQRSLSIMPGDWSEEARGSISTYYWRKEVWGYAVESIKQNPFFGKGFSVLKEFIRVDTEGAEGERVFPSETAFWGHSYHNLYLAVAADLGLIYFIFFLWSLCLHYRAIHKCVKSDFFDSRFHMVKVFLLFLLVSQIMGYFSSGDMTYSFPKLAVYLGLINAVSNYERDRYDESAASPQKL